MPQLLQLSRAARLLGLTRGALQRRIQSGELPSFDGMVALEDLVRLYPQAELEDGGAFERVTQIKEQAFGRRVAERTLPSQALLAERVFEQSRELADVRSHLQRYHALVVRLREAVDAAAAGAQPQVAGAMERLGALLDRELETVLASETADSLTAMDDLLRVVTAHVVMQPSGQEFFVDGADSILEAGVRAGLALNYGCSNGVCGLCKARVVSGQVKLLRPHDHVLSQAEKQAGYILPCCNTAITDVVLEALVASRPGDIPEQQIATHVKAVTALSADVTLLHLQTPRSNRLRFLAGQRVALGIPPADSAELYVASCPCDDHNLHFHIARGAEHAIAQRIEAGRLQPGDTVTVWGPWGDFVLNEAVPRPLVFLACDTGFAPVRSLIEHAMARESFERIDLYWLATRPDGHYLANLCRSWADAIDGVRYVPLEAGGDLAAEAARLAQRALQDGAPLAGCEVFLAGPQQFVDAAATQLTAVPQAQLHVALV